MKKIFVSLFIILMMTTNPANATMTKEAHQLYQEACQLEYRNNYDAAISKIREAIDMTGEDAILYTKLAGLYADIGDYDNALGTYNRFEKDLENAKETIIASINASKDSQSGIINTYFAKVLVGSKDFDERIENIKKVTKEDIMDVAKKVYIHTEYILKGDSDEENSDE